DNAPFQLWHHRRNLKMTRQEVRDEQKETDGKPEVKQRIRLLQQQRANQRMMDEVPQATVVITNPTHYAVAVRYDQSRDSAPVVVAKGRDRIAARIREIADDNGVALFSAPPLARVLFRSTKLGQQIPYELYTAVAQVLAYVLRVRDAARPWLIDRPEPDVDEAAFVGLNGGAER
ncbi:MAG: EscU/YscU/HrcU family type III secretion system export apparatus switch protein, partial [Pseudomonadota bacterium]